MFQKASDIENVFGLEKRCVYYDFLSKSVSHSPGKFGMASLFCFTENRVSKKLTDNKGTWLFSDDNCLFHRAEKFRAETIRCFRKLRVSKVFMDKRRGWCITIFCQSFCLTVPRTVVGEPFCVSENFGYRKCFWIREEVCVLRFFVKVCVSQSRKIWYGKPSLFHRKSGIEKTYG